jgi:hypothetical protein
METNKFGSLRRNARVVNSDIYNGEQRKGFLSKHHYTVKTVR